MRMVDGMILTGDIELVTVCMSTGCSPQEFIIGLGTFKNDLMAGTRVKTLGQNDGLYYKDRLAQIKV